LSSGYQWGGERREEGGGRRRSPERRRRSPERRSMVEERREDEMKRGGEDQPYIRHTNGAPRAGAPLVIFLFFLFILNFEGGKILMAHHGQVRH